MMGQFIHLHTHSAYSLAEGAIQVKDLIKLCVQENMPAVGVTDTNNLFGALEFAVNAAAKGVQPIIGTQINVGLEKHQLVLLAQTERGYRNLCKLVSDAYLGKEDNPHTDYEELSKLSDGVICLTGGVAGPVAQALLHNQKDLAQKTTKTLKKIFGDRLYIEIQRHHTQDEARCEDALIDLAYKHEIPLVASNDCYFPTRDRHEAHDALLCIAGGRYVTEDDRRKVTQDHYFKSSDEMIKLFHDLPEAVENTVKIAQRCHFLLKEIDPILPPFESENGRNEVDELRAQSQDGLKWRLENFVTDGTKESIAKPYLERLDYELNVIEEMGFPGYFLIVSDFIKWAKDNNIPVGPGRGSGAGSVVAWALKITDLDPLRFGLLFERFLNPERVSMPDFDVDFCQDRRDEVIHYVQEKYGNDRVAQIITFGKLQARAVVRDVGRVLQMPYGQVDRIAKMIPNNPANPLTLAEALEQDEDLRAERIKEETTDKLITIALQLEGLYRHASTHAAGVVIGDRPLHELLPLYRDPRSDMPVTQFSMKYIEPSGLVKFDFLGLKTMTVIQKTVEMVKETQGHDVDVLKLPLDDKKSYDLMAQGMTVGVFQLEGAGMRDMLKKVRPNRFEDIIALVSLYRPGPMDNIPRYIAVREGHEEPDYLHPVLKPILEETSGIIIYQEQVMQAAQLLSGYTLGGADLLRRAMGKKIKEAMEEERAKFIAGALETHQVPEEKSSEIFDQIAKFAGYGFNKSHAAAYALIAYWTAWLKANYPVEFMAASMTLDYGNTDKLAIFKQELDRMDMPLLPPDVNKSHVFFACENNAVRYALSALKGVGEGAMRSLVQERNESGEFKNLSDYLARLDSKAMNRRQFEMLTKAGAFDSFDKSRADLVENSEILLRAASAYNEDKTSGQENLFATEGTADFQLPPLKDAEQWDPLESLANEFGAVGFYITAHPLDSKIAMLDRLNISTYADLERKLNEKSSLRVQMAAIVISKKERISAKSGKKYAFVTFSDPGGVYEALVFSDILAEQRELLTEGHSVLVSIDAETKDDQIRMTVGHLQDLETAIEGFRRDVMIRIDHSDAIAHIKGALMDEGDGHTRVLIHTDRAEIELPGRWGFGESIKKRLHKGNGIIDIEEL